MMKYYIDTQTLEVISGPHHIQSSEIKTIVNNGNPERMSDLELISLGIVDYIVDDYNRYISKVGSVDVYVDSVVATLVPLSVEEKEAILPQLILEIWSAADRYVEEQISGAAYGMVSTLITLNKITPGVGVKGLAAKNWIDGVWGQYYTNKFILQGGGSFSESMLDYSAHGEMPHTVPELKVELDAALV
jgi:hypothetical protein